MIPSFPFSTSTFNVFIWKFQFCFFEGTLKRTLSLKVLLILPMGFHYFYLPVTPGQRVQPSPAAWGWSQLQRLRAQSVHARWPWTIRPHGVSSLDSNSGRWALQWSKELVGSGEKRPGWQLLGKSPFPCTSKSGLLPASFTYVLSPEAIVAPFLSFSLVLEIAS